MTTTSRDGGIDNLRRVDVSQSCDQSPELSPEQIGRAIEHSSVMVIITDAGGRIEYVNPCFSAMTGYRLEDIAGKSPRILKSGHSPEGEYRKLWSAIRRGDDWRGEFCNRRKDGTLYWSNAAISPVKAADGAITHFIAVQVDIGEQKRIEQELRLSEQQFRSLAETSLLGICIDRGNLPLFVNQSFAGSRRAPLLRMAVSGSSIASD